MTSDKNRDVEKNRELVFVSAERSRQSAV